ncbi:hypothetical protein SEA_CAMERICO_101 [Gordonia phage Camerico]|nr:hypothetical protein SEA_CAMERICO_101 [Gordonia phage Camerico]
MTKLTARDEILAAALNAGYVPLSYANHRIDSFVNIQGTRTIHIAYTAADRVSAASVRDNGGEYLADVQPFNKGKRETVMAWISRHAETVSLVKTPRPAAPVSLEKTCTCAGEIMHRSHSADCAMGTPRAVRVRRINAGIRAENIARGTLTDLGDRSQYWGARTVRLADTILADTENEPHEPVILLGQSTDAVYRAALAAGLKTVHMEEITTVSRNELVKVFSPGDKEIVTVLWVRYHDSITAEGATRRIIGIDNSVSTITPGRALKTVTMWGAMKNGRFSSRPRPRRVSPVGNPVSLVKGETIVGDYAVRPKGHGFSVFHRATDAEQIYGVIPSRAAAIAYAETRNLATA